jgi:hypothetical protein
LALQTREQHIRRDKATSNICTAQVLLAVIAAMYAVYHGPKGLRAIAQRVHNFTAKLAEGLRQLGFRIAYENFFDTIRVELGQALSSNLIERAERAGCNLRAAGDHAISISLDETTTDFEIETLMSIFRGTSVRDFDDAKLIPLRSAFRNSHPQLRLSHSSGFQYVSQRNRNAAVSPTTRIARSLALSLHDSARFLHHEIKRHCRNVPDFVAGIREAASVRAGFANFRLSRNVQSTRALARGNYRIRRRLFTT